MLDMRITESRLRSLIRSVISEQKKEKLKKLNYEDITNRIVFKSVDLSWDKDSVIFSVDLKGIENKFTVEQDMFYDWNQDVIDNYYKGNIKKAFLDCFIMDLFEKIFRIYYNKRIAVGQMRKIKKNHMSHIEHLSKKIIDSILEKNKEKYSSFEEMMKEAFELNALHGDHDD